MLDQSIQECNTALELDPGNFSFRWCAWSFLEMGNPDRAMDFARLDAGTEWAAWSKFYIYLAKGDLALARDAVKSVGKSGTYHRDLMVACTAPQPPTDLNKTVSDSEAAVMTEPDPEAWYHLATLMAACGQKEAALRLLQAAISQNYCQYSGLLNDPLLKGLRREAEFANLLKQASACQTILRVR